MDDSKIVGKKKRCYDALKGSEGFSPITASPLSPQHGGFFTPESPSRPEEMPLTEEQIAWMYRGITLE